MHAQLEVAGDHCHTEGDAHCPEQLLLAQPILHQIFVMTLLWADIRSFKRMSLVVFSTVPNSCTLPMLLCEILSNTLLSADNSASAQHGLPRLACLVMTKAAADQSTP